MVEWHCMELVIDKAGRIVIPKPVRQELRLEAGDALELNREGEILHLRPVRSQIPLHREHGIWVYRGASAGAAVDADSLLAAIREQRIRDLTR
jgi:AbrB family looped-hinge helix DNA binding protein